MMKKESHLIYIHYNRKDVKLVHRAIEHLRVMERVASVQLWTTDNVRAGEELQTRIKSAIERAKIIIVFISPSLLQELEITSSTSSATLEYLLTSFKGLVLPILARPCAWEIDTHWNNRQILPRTGKALSLYKAPDRDSILKEISAEVLDTLQNVQSNSITSIQCSIGAREMGLNSPLWASYNHKGYVVRSREEGFIRRFVNHDGPGQPTVVCAPHLFGKTWMLRYILGQETHKNDNIVLINLELILAENYTSINEFLLELANLITEEILDDNHLVSQLWRAANPINSFKRVIERLLIESGSSRLILALDRADAIVKYSFRDVFFSMLRSMCDVASKDCWKKFRLLLLITHKPNSLIQDPNRSPFNLTPTIFLDEFTENQTKEMFALYSIKLTTDMLNQVRNLIGGHPYLVHLVAYSVANGLLDINELHPAKVLPEIFLPFRDYTIRKIHANQHLSMAIQNIIHKATERLDPAIGAQLVREGVLVEESIPGVYRMRCRLYETLLAGN